MIRRPPRSPLFPHSTLFRSHTGVLLSLVRSAEAESRLRFPPAPATPGEHLARAVQEVVAGSLDADLQRDRKSTRLNSSHANISYAVFCLKKTKKNQTMTECP